MTQKNTRRGFTRQIIKNKVILNLIQDLQRLLCLLCKGVRGRCQIKFGMTSLFIKEGFTLIELLVVVLIIGILAAVALPQYQFAVMKSRYATLKSLVQAIAHAQEIYYLEHGTYANDFTKLDVSMPGGKDEENSTPQRYVYDWGNCHMGGTGEQSICYHNDLQMQYHQNLLHYRTHPGQSACVIINSTETTGSRQKLCKQETNATSSVIVEGKHRVYYYVM